jgi:hypothetical protein
MTTGKAAAASAATATRSETNNDGDTEDAIMVMIMMLKGPGRISSIEEQSVVPMLFRPPRHRRRFRFLAATYHFVQKPWR